jgi:hypothetical protein
VVEKDRIHKLEAEVEDLRRLVDLLVALADREIRERPGADQRRYTLPVEAIGLRKQ